MLGLDLTANVKLAVILIIIPRILLHYKPNLWSLLFQFFIVNFVHVKLFFFTLYLFWYFHSRMDKPNKNISIFQTCEKQSWNIKIICFLTFGFFFSKYTFFRLRHFFSSRAYQINSFFQWLYVFIQFIFFMELFPSQQPFLW